MTQPAFSHFHVVVPPTKKPWTRPVHGSRSARVMPSWTAKYQGHAAPISARRSAYASLRDNEARATPTLSGKIAARGHWLRGSVSVFWTAARKVRLGNVRPTVHAPYSPLSSIHGRPAMGHR